MLTFFVQPIVFTASQASSSQLSSHHHFPTCWLLVFNSSHAPMLSFLSASGALLPNQSINQSINQETINRPINQLVNKQSTHQQSIPQSINQTKPVVSQGNAYIWPSILKVSLSAYCAHPEFSPPPLTLNSSICQAVPYSWPSILMVALNTYFGRPEFSPPPSHTLNSSMS